MSTPQVGSVLRAWYRWKALRLPWRKRFLVGLDLQGNTYWIFRDPLAPPSSNADIADPNTTTSRRWRRIVKYPNDTHYSEIKVPPPWHQWLRYQREHPPSLTEQSQDVLRQQRIKVLAAEADARWEAKPSLLRKSGPEKAQTVPSLDTAKTQPQEQGRGADGTAAASGTAGAGDQSKATVKEDPWKRPTGPSEAWQPEAWSPPAAKRR